MVKCLARLLVNNVPFGAGINSRDKSAEQWNLNYWIYYFHAYS
jgi:hypothetical protein